MEKIIDDIKIVETEDGFRVEIKGDKEAIRRMLQSCGAGFPFGRGSCFDFAPGFWSTMGEWCGCCQEAGGEKKTA